LIYTIPKKWIFQNEWSEPKYSPKCVFLKQAIYKEATLVVKRISDKYCVTLQFGSGDLFYEGVAIFGASNEKNGIDAAEEAAIRMKIAKRE
jgi:hypothetical protein